MKTNKKYVYGAIHVLGLDACYSATENNFALRNREFVAKEIKEDEYEVNDKYNNFIGYNSMEINSYKTLDEAKQHFDHLKKIEALYDAHHDEKGYYIEKIHFINGRCDIIDKIYIS
jgi:hypothetical protein